MKKKQSLKDLGFRERKESRPKKRKKKSLGQRFLRDAKELSKEAGEKIGRFGRKVAKKLRTKVYLKQDSQGVFRGRTS